MIVLGIDPGTTTVGYSLVKKEQHNIELLDYGIISTQANIDFEIKICEIIGDLQCLIEKYQPQKAVIEKLYFQNNSKTAIDVAQARGAIIFKLHSQNIKILEYTPLQLKKAICGHGRAQKKQLQTAIKILFNLQTIPKPDDAADAIGLAYMGILERGE